MSKNYMEQVARMLGVEVEERFKIKGYEDSKFYINKDGLQCNCSNNEIVTGILSNIMTGKYEIVKIPKRKHTGLESVAKKDEAVYILFGFRQSVSAPEPAELQTDFFTDKEIRNNWERYIDIKKRLARAASELNTEPIDWNDENKAKWYISCDPKDNNDLIFNNRIYKGPGDDIYFNKAGAAKKAIEIVGKDDLIWMLRDFQAFIGYSREAAADE